MIAVDTNVVVRLLTRDDEGQYQAAYLLFEREQIFIPSTVVLETEWVLRFAYQYGSVQIVQTLRSLFGLPNVELERPAQVAEALDWYVQGLDFADALHLTASKETAGFSTFDKKLIAKSRELLELPVSPP